MFLFESANFLAKYLYLCLAKIRIPTWKFRFLSMYNVHRWSLGPDSVAGQKYNITEYWFPVIWTAGHNMARIGSQRRRCQDDQISTESLRWKNNAGCKFTNTNKNKNKIHIGCQYNQISTESLRQKNNAGCSNNNSGPILFSG